MNRAPDLQMAPSDNENFTSVVLLPVAIDLSHTGATMDKLIESFVVAPVPRCMSRCPRMNGHF